MAMMDDAQNLINEATILLGKEFPKDGTAEERAEAIEKARVYALLGIAESLKMLNWSVRAAGTDQG